MALQAPPAGAADSIYWGVGTADQIAFAALDGSGGGTLATGAATVDNPRGVAIDSAAGRIYWANNFGTEISYAALDGSGGGDLATGTATASAPTGVSLDIGAGRIYWANAVGNKISFAKLDGSGGGDLNTGAATVNVPNGVTVDPAAGRIYWANFAGDKISLARLDGTGGGDLSVGTATVSGPNGVAIDHAAGRIYWANYGAGANKISYAALDGTGGGDINTAGATLARPSGVALDPAAGRIYWVNTEGTVRIAFARLDGTGGADVPTPGAPALSAAGYPGILRSPLGTLGPVVSGGGSVGSTLSCSQGSWAGDIGASIFYRGPSGFAYRWTVGGAPVAGATASTLSAATAGDYRCEVTAANQAGTATQTSAPHAVAGAAFGASTRVSLRLVSSRIGARGPVQVRVSNANTFGVTGSLSGQTSSKVAVPAAKKRTVRLAAKRFTVAANGRRTVKLSLPRPLRKLLAAKRRLSLRLSAKVTDPAGNSRTVRATVKPKLKAKKRPRRGR